VFTTRRGGVSTGAYASLNLGRHTADQPDAVQRNRAALQERFGVRFVYGRQVHGAHVARVAAPSAEPAAGEADGQCTDLPGVAPMVLTADCLPVALAGPRAVAMLHAGWRGVAKGIVAEGVRALRALDAAGSLAAAIGPGVGVCCYEVGEEVHAALQSAGRSARRERNLDLKAIVRRELEAAGVARIHDVGLCTICTPPSLFYSHRRDGAGTGRQAGFAWLT
jgi:YfiH family protein